MLMWHKSPLVSMQLLWINLVTDSLPAISLGMEAVENDVMEHKPKPKNESLFAHGYGVRVVLQGCMFAALSLIAYYVGESVTGLEAGGQTLTFMVLALCQIVQAFNMRSEHSLFKIGPFTNHKLNWAALISTLLMALVLFTPVRGAFGLIALPANLYLIGLGLIFVPLVVMELSKAVGLIKHQALTASRHEAAAKQARRELPRSISKNGAAPMRDAAPHRHFMDCHDLR